MIQIPVFGSFAYLLALTPTCPCRRPWPVARAKALCKATKRETLCGMDAECRTLKPGETEGF